VVKTSRLNNCGRAKRYVPRLPALLESLESRLLLSTTDPVIFNITGAVTPGQILGIEGGNFGSNAQVWIDRITDSSDTPNPEMQLSTVLTHSVSYVAAEVPLTLQEGLYAVFVKNTDTNVVSAYTLTNQAAAWQYLDLAGAQIDPGRSFRIYGQNLDFAATTSTVQFRSVSDGTLLNATVTQGSDPFILQVTAPLNLVTGVTYDVLVNNGYGGSYGQTVGPQLKARAGGGVDHWNIGTPWAQADFGFYNNVYDIKNDPRLTLHAVGDGVADDHLAIQQAINAANAAGGGVVYFAPGTYNLNGVGISMKSNVVLEGAGRDVSKIYDNLGGQASMFSGAVNAVGLSKLTLESGPTGFWSTWKVGGTANYSHFIIDSRMIQPTKEDIVYGASGMMIRGNEIIQTTLTGKCVMDLTSRWDVIIKDNYIQWSDGRLDLLSMNRLQIEGNTFSRSIYTDATNLGYGGPSMGGTNNVAILNNVFNKVASEPDTRIPKNNDGETLMNEDIEYKALGYATDSTDTTLIDSTKIWTVNTMANWQVTIIQGTGIGQTRNIASNSATALTLSAAWDINPDATSAYAVTKFNHTYLVKGNTLQEVPRGIWVLYGCSMYDANIIDNTLIDTNGIYLRGDTRPSSGPNRFNVQKNVRIEGNTVTDTKGWYPAQIVISQTAVDGTQLYGDAFYNVVVRSNTINGGTFVGTDDGSGMGEGYYVLQSGISDNDTAGVMGVIFDGNTANNLSVAYHVNSGSYQTVIWNGVNNSVGAVVSDGTMSGDTHASVDTVVGWTSLSAAPPYVWVQATDASAAETGPDSANFRIHRSGTTGDLVVNYVTSGAATAADITQVLTGSVTILDGQQYVDLPITPIDDLVYYEGVENLTITLAPSATYRIGNPAATVTIADNDVTYNVAEAGFSGSGSGSGAGSIMDFGGTATLKQGSTGNTAFIGTSPDMNGSFLHLETTATGTSGGVTITPTDATTSWASIATKPGSQWLLNGAFDFFYRADGTSIGAREMDFSNTGGGGWRITMFHSATNMRMEFLPPSGAAAGSSFGGIGNFPAALVTGQIYHLAVTLNTDPNTGVVTVRYFLKAGTGAIGTTSSANRIYSGSFNPDENVVTNTPSAGSFFFGDLNAAAAGKSNDFDSIRLWKSDPGILPDIANHTAISVAATDPNASRSPLDAGTFTLSRLTTVGNQTVYFSLDGTAPSSDYSSSVLGSVVIGDGQSSATVTITPVSGTSGPNETVQLHILPDLHYSIGTPSATITIAGTVASTATALTASANPSVFGQSVTFTAVVSPTGGVSGTPTGTVTFLDGATTLGSGTLNNGSATFTTSAPLAVGTHSITAVYGSDATFAGSTSSSLVQAVGQAGTTTQLGASANPSVFGQLVTFTAAVAAIAPGAGTPTGTVTFKDGATVLGTGTLNAGTATFTTTASLGAGNHSITAAYGSDTNFAGSASAALTQVVNRASTTTTLGALSSPSVYGQGIAFTATVAPVAPGAGTPTGTVTFMDGAAMLGVATLNNGSATFNVTSPLAVGSHSITAVYSSETSFSASTSSVGTQIVNRAGTTTALSQSLSSSMYGQAVTFTASVSPVAPGAGSVSGTIKFLDGATTLGTATLSGGTASASFTLAAGSHSITASYAGNASFSSSVSTAVTQSVSPANTTTTLTTSGATSVSGQTVTFTATIAPVAPGAGIASGTVTFMDGATVLGTGTVNASGKATFATALLSVGSHSVTAVYAGSANFGSSTSAAVAQTVGKNSTVTALNSSAKPSVSGQSVTFTATVTASAPGGGVPAGTVTFKDGTTTLGTVTLNSAGVATFATATLSVANHSITAVYNGSASSLASTSAALTQTVNKKSTLVTLTSSLNPSVFGQFVTFTITVSPVAPGSGTPTGTVTLKDGGKKLATLTLNSSGQATYTVKLSKGSHTITAIYNGDTKSLSSTSAALTEVVN